MSGSSGKRLPTLSNCYCRLTSPFITRKSMVKIFAFHSLGGSTEPPLGLPRVVKPTVVSSVINDTII